MTAPAPLVLTLDFKLCLNLRVAVATRNRNAPSAKDAALLAEYDAALRLAVERELTLKPCPPLSLALSQAQWLEMLGALMHLSHHCASRGATYLAATYRQQYETLQTEIRRAPLRSERFG